MGQNLGYAGQYEYGAGDAQLAGCRTPTTVTKQVAGRGGRRGQRRPARRLVRPVTVRFVPRPGLSLTTPRRRAAGVLRAGVARVDRTHPLRVGRVADIRWRRGGQQRQRKRAHLGELRGQGHPGMWCLEARRVCALRRKTSRKVLRLTMELLESRPPCMFYV